MVMFLLMLYFVRIFSFFYNLSKQFCIIGIYREALYYEYGQPEVYETAYPGKNPLLSDFPADSSRFNNK